MTDLVQRLRDEARIWDPSPLTKLCNEAADRIEALERGIADRIEALEFEMTRLMGRIRELNERASEGKSR